MKRIHLGAAAFALTVTVGANALTVKMKAETTGGDMPTVVGTTNLPDGVELIVTLRRKEAKYSAQDKAVVSGGSFKAGPFSQNHSPLNPGKYVIEVSMSLPTFQPASARQTMGETGQNLEGPISKKSRYGGRVVEYATTTSIGNGKTLAAQDKTSIANEKVKSHEWWLKSCKSNADLVRALAVKRNESFNYDQNVAKCIREESKKN